MSGLGSDPGVYVILDSGNMAAINLLAAEPGKYFYRVKFSDNVTEADMEDFTKKIASVAVLANTLESERSEDVPRLGPRPRAEC